MADDKTNTATGIAWNLGDLYAGLDDPKVTRDLDEAQRRAAAFEATHRGKIVELGPEDGDFLLAAMRELEGLSEQMDKPSIYAMLVHSARTDVPTHGALLTMTRERRTAINKHLIFFDLEWVKVPAKIVQALLADPRMTPYRHFLEQKLLWRPYYLSEPEEKILDEKSVTGRSALGRLFEETCATLTTDIAGKKASLQEALAKLYDPDRETRRLAAQAISQTLGDNSRLLTFLFNVVVQDHQVDVRLRGYPGVMFARNLANEISAEVVEALMSSVEKRYDLVQRYYRLKGKLLGIDNLQDYDRYAPLFSDLPSCDWPTARSIVEESYAAMSPDAGKIIREFFDRKWIDAELRPGKRGGAFSASAV
ncbi:MAG TPA: M3 family metallopeptidase, partial [Gemmataceae bacterium]|nr:M3 family metallopeptidase [Gemmataceae bacterium]